MQFNEAYTLLYSYIVFTIYLKVFNALLLRLLSLFVLLIVSVLLFAFNDILTEESHFFNYFYIPGLDDLKVWNNVEAFVFFNESIDIYDFCLETFENFLLENCKKAAWFENLLYFCAFLT